MNKYFLLALITPFALFSCPQQEWEVHWKKALEHRQQKNSSEYLAELESCYASLGAEHDLAFIEIELANAKMNEQKYEEARTLLLHTINRESLTKDEKTSALFLLSLCELNQNNDDSAWEHYSHFKDLYGHKIDQTYTDTHIYMRNVPECPCFKKIMSSVYDRPENGSYIEFCDDGSCIIKKPDCSCKMAATPSPEREKCCKGWCNKMHRAGLIWCSNNFKSYYCKVACGLTVDALKDGCYYCCQGGDYYNNCIKPFEDIAGRMDPSKCDPLMDY